LPHPHSTLQLGSSLPLVELGGLGEDIGVGVLGREVLEGGEHLVDAHHAPFDRDLAVERARRPQPDFGVGFQVILALAFRQFWTKVSGNFGLCFQDKALETGVDAHHAPFDRYLAMERSRCPEPDTRVVSFRGPWSSGNLNLVVYFPPGSHAF